MKQTNNAIKFLLAQYRAIFKHAYLKGLASAVVLTAGLAAGASANAAAANDPLQAINFEKLSDSNAKLEVVADESTTGDASFDAVQVEATSGEYTWNGTLTVNNGAADPAASTSDANNFIKAGAADTQITGSGILNISGNGIGLAVVGADGKALSIDIGTIDVQEGTLNLSGSTSGKVSVSATNINLGDSGNSTSGEAILQGVAADYVANLGSSSSDITVNSGSKITMKGFSTVTAKSLTINSGTIATSTAASNSITVGSALFNAGTLTVEDALTLAVAEKAEPKVDEPNTPADVVFSGTNITTTKVLTLSGGTFDFKNVGTMEGADGTDDGIVLTSGATASFTEEKLQAYLTAASSKSGSVSLNSGSTLELDSLTVGGSAPTKLATTKEEGSLDAESGATIEVETLNISGAAGGEIQAAIKAQNLSFSAFTATTNLKDVTVSEMLTNSAAVTIKDTIKLYNTAQDPATISGSDAFTLADDTGILDIQGKWDAKTTISLSGGSASSLTLDSGDELSFTGASGKLSAGKLGTVTVGKDATLTFNEGATLEVKGADASNLGHVLVSGGNVVFNQGSNLNVSSGDFTVTNGSSVDLTNLTADQVTVGDDGAIKAGESGTIVIDSDLVAKSITADNGGTLKAINLNLSADNLSANNLNILNGGTLVVDNLSFTETSAKAVSGLQGTVQVNTQLSASGSNAVEFSSGILQLGESDGSTLKGAIKSDLTVGNTTNVFGTWKSDSEKNINVAGTLNVGDADTTASLTTNKFTSTSGKTTVSAGSTLTANEIAYTAGAIEVDGNMTVNGTKPTTTPETVTDGYAGFGLTQATGNNAIKVNANGTFTIGSGAADSMITSMEWTKPETTPEGDQGLVYNNFGQYDLTNGGTLSLQFSSSDTKFTAEQLKELKLELITNTNSETGVLTNGKLDLGAAKLESLEGILVESADGTYTTSWDNYQSAIQDGGMADTMNDELAATKVTDVNSAFYGNAGSVQLKSGTSALEVEGTTALAGADTNNGYFVSTSDGKKAAGMDVTTSAVKVSLQGSGKIGQVTLVAGDTNTNNNTTLSLEAGRNAAEGDKFDITVAGVQAVDVSGEILNNTAVNVAQNVTANFTDEVKVDVLTFNGNANFVSGSKSTNAESNELSTAAGTAVTAGTLTVNKLVNVKGNLQANTLSLTDTLSEDEDGNSVKGVVAGTVTAKTFDATNISLSNETNVTDKFTATDVAIEETSVVSAGSASLNGTTDIDGQLLAENGTVALNADSTTNVNNILQTKEITLAAASVGNATSLNVNDGFVSATKITGASGALIAVGADATEEHTSGYTGSLAVTDVLDLSGATLKVDPEYGQKTALVAVNALQGQTVINKETKDVGILNGNVFVGQNSALGVGVDLTGLQSVIAQYQDANGSLLDPNDATNPGKYGAIAYFDKPVSIDSKYGLVLTDGTVDELRTYVSGSTGAMQDYATNSAYAPAGVIYFGNNTALAVNTDNAKSGSYITFVDSSKDNAATKGTLVADGGDIVLYGNTFKKSYQLFNKEVVIQDLAGNDDSADAVIDVVTANGFLTGTLDNNSSGSVSLSIDKDNMGVMMAGTSTPVQQTIVAYINGYNGDAKSFEESDDADKLFGYNENDEKDYDAYNNYFLSQVVIGGRAADVEKVARLGVYGGVAQAALTASASTYEAVNGRMGIGAQTGSITFADNGQGAGLWVTPVYKNHDSDGFDAQGVSYGADLDLYGVALGGDYTLANGLRVGAAFNVGSGDADGQGAGAGVSNDFDYYGFTVYGGYTLDKLSVVADISYTAIDNDVEANTGVEKVTASMDSSNLSVGVTGQYAFDMNGVSVTPHAGLRYTYIDMDDYTVKGSEDIAKYSADSASVFSIPVGVTFAKDIVSGDWTIKPALDLTLTANMGDDSVDGSVTWAGVENLKTNLESEVIDNFTYGATLGVSAKSGNMSFGFGVNYTGSSSADEYGVSANARFVF